MTSGDVITLNPDFFGFASDFFCVFHRSLDWVSLLYVFIHLDQKYCSYFLSELLKQLIFMRFWFALFLVVTCYYKRSINIQ